MQHVAGGYIDKISLSCVSRSEMCLLFSLISQEWIVTAAHCFCMKPLGCKSDHGGRKTVVDFDLKRVTVYVGK